MRSLFALILALSISACQRDETVAAYGGAGQVWRLVELDNRPFDARATVTFPEFGRIAGQAPCNSYSGVITAPYPWFEVGSIAATRRACDALGFETVFFAALADMTQSEVSGTTMILRDDAGREMLFLAGAAVKE